MVNPELSIPLRGDLRTPDPSVLDDYKVELAITYDFLTNSSYLEIISGADNTLDYYFVSDSFRATLTVDDNDAGVPFTYKIPSLFTDSYCILNEPLSGISLHVKDKQGQVLASYTTDITYEQLLKKQVFYKYFEELEDTTPVVASSDTMAYLDNNQNNVMSTFDEVMQQSVDSLDTQTPVEKYILRMPFISSDYFFSKTPLETFEVFNTFFIMNLTEEFINYNTLATQTFHNTIDIPPKYYDSLFERNTMPDLTSPRIPIDIEIHANRLTFMTSRYSTETEFDTALRIEIIKFLKQKEGFTMEFFETDLEKYLYEMFNPLILNIAVLSPTLFQVNSSSEVYRNIQNTLDFKDVLDFVPPYFTYTYNDMSLKITW